MSPYIRIKQTAYAAIEARFRCEHPTRELRRRAIGDGRRPYYRQCLTCGHAGQAVPAATALCEFGGSAEAPAFDIELEPQWRGRKHATYIQAYEELKPALRAEYASYLSSHQWRTRRSPILTRAAGRCECCEYFAPSEVHHITYSRLGCELDSDLIAVCGFCHGLLHQPSAA